MRSARRTRRRWPRWRPPWNCATNETGGHAYRVTEIALSLARVVDAELAVDAEARFGYLLHDIGKIGIPDRILRKPAALTGDERRIMETHAELGEYLISSLRHLQGVAAR